MNVKQIWQAALADLEAQTSRPNFETWVRPVSAVSFEGGAFVVAAPSSFARHWLESRLLPEISQAVARVVGRAVEVRVTVRGDEPTAEPAEEPTSSRPDDDPPNETTSSPDQTATEARLGPAPVAWTPSPRYTFATFVVGSSNQLAHAAAQSVAERPGLAYNPLFIYGGVGLGKTHLLHAIAHVVARAGLRALYVTSEAFTNEMIAAIRERRTDEFRARYRSNDVLLVDDVQFIAGKDSTQEEFFHTFNSLHDAGRQVVLSSDRPPRAMATLEDRLRSRFEWGLIADIQAPDVETRTAILQRKAAEQRLDISDEVIAYLAQRIQSNIRELEGSLNRVVAHANLTGRSLSLETAAAALSDLMANPVRRFITASHVVDAVCRYYRVDARALRGKARGKEIVVPRQVAMYLIREETDSSLVDVGRELGRDHSTVLHGINKIQTEIEADAQLRKDVLAVRELLYASARP